MDSSRGVKTDRPISTSMTITACSSQPKISTQDSNFEKFLKACKMGNLHEVQQISIKTDNT